MQRPAATRVAGYRAWQALGRQVRRGAKGIAILCPAPLKATTEEGEEEITLRFRTGYVFDIADTDGPPLTALTVHAVEGDRYDALLRRLIEIAEHGGLTVRFRDRLPDDANGLSYGDGRIELKAGNPAGNLCKTLLHEVAHERMHRENEGRSFPRRQLECQAEAVAYCVCQALSVPTPNTPTYLAFHGITRDQLADNLDAIRAGVASLLQEIGPALAVEPAEMSSAA
jgi:hypothetical protein